METIQQNKKEKGNCIKIRQKTKKYNKIKPKYNKNTTKYNKNKKYNKIQKKRKLYNIDRYGVEKEEHRIRKERGAGGTK